MLPNTWRKISVIDLGHNSLKMVSYEVRYDGTFRAYNQMSKITKIGDGLERTGFLDSERIKRTIDELKLFNEVNRMEKIHDVLAVATSAVREAKNRDEFLTRASTEAHTQFRVLSQEEEALLSFVGGADSTDYDNTLHFDLGGGSLELVHSSGRKVTGLVSLPLGALKMANRFQIMGRDSSEKNLARLTSEINSLLPERKTFGINESTVLLGVGGTIRALARYDQWIKKYPLYKMHNYVLQKSSLDEISRLFLKTDIEKIAKLDAVGKDRAQSVTAGSLVISLLMEKYGFNQLTVSSHGLRDGILMEYLRNPRTYFTRVYDVEAANTALQIKETKDPRIDMVRSMARTEIISRKEERILYEVIGKFMDLYLSTRPETLFYSVISQDSILSHSDQVMAAVALVRAKAPRMARWFQTIYSELPGDLDKKAINKIGLIIQLTEILYISGSKATFEKLEDTLNVRVKAGSRKTFPETVFAGVTHQLREITGLEMNTVIS